MDDVSFTLGTGERMGLIGESGSGKTTMATAVTRLIRPPGRITGGRALINDVDLVQLGQRDLRGARGRDAALIPQAAMNSLNPVMRIGDQVADAILAHEEASKRQQRERVATALERVGLAATVATRFPHELSGGQKQRESIGWYLRAGHYSRPL